MAGKAAGSVVKAVGEYQYPWRDKLVKYKDELTKGVWGYWELGILEMKTRRKGHKCDRISAEKRENSARLMEKMPDMLLDYKKRRWEKKMRKKTSEGLVNIALCSVLPDFRLQRIW